MSSPKAKARTSKKAPDITGGSGPDAFKALGLGTPEYGGGEDLGPEQRAHLDRQVEQAERDIDAKFGLTTSITIRWTPEALSDVKAAARRAGVPYQTWLKVVAHKEALAQLSAAKMTASRAAKENRATRSS